MDTTELMVLGGGVGMIVLIYYYFFGPKEEGGGEAVREGKTQVAMVTVDAAYIPEIVKLKVDVPAEITFDRKDKGDCTEWVIFEKLPTKEGKEIKARLSEGERTTLKFTPTKSGEYEFVCGMGMVHGKLIIK